MNFHHPVCFIYQRHSYSLHPSMRRRESNIVSERREQRVLYQTDNASVSAVNHSFPHPALQLPFSLTHSLPSLSCLPLFKQQRPRRLRWLPCRPQTRLLLGRTQPRHADTHPPYAYYRETTQMTKETMTRRLIAQTQNATSCRRRSCPTIPVKDQGLSVQRGACMTRTRSWSRRRKRT